MDLSGYKSLKVGGVDLVKLVINGVVAWAKKTYTNLVPTSTDTDGSIYNKVGYKDNVRLSSSGGISSSAQAGSVTIGFIPFGGDTDVIRMQGAEWEHENGKHYYIVFYDANKSKLDHLSAESYSGGTWTHVVEISRDANGVTTFDFNEDYGTGNAWLNNVRQASFFRITAKGSGEDMIVTINEEI